MDEPLSIIWRGPILPHESCWNILARMAVQNYFQLSSLRRTLWPADFHGDPIRPFPQEFWGEAGIRRLRHIGEFIHLSEKHFRQAFLADCVRPHEIKLLVHSSLRYCSECGRQGYHSSLHQLMLLHNCPIHGCVLTTRCQNCGGDLGTGTLEGLHGIGSCHKCGYRFWFEEAAGTMATETLGPMDVLRSLLLQRLRVLYESMLFPLTEQAAQKLRALPSWESLMRSKIHAYSLLEGGREGRGALEIGIEKLVLAESDFSDDTLVKNVSTNILAFRQTYAALGMIIRRYHGKCLASPLTCCAAVEAFKQWMGRYEMDTLKRGVILEVDEARLPHLHPNLALELSGIFLSESLQQAHPTLSATVFRQELLADYYGKLLGFIQLSHDGRAVDSYDQPRFYWYLPNWLVASIREDQTRCRLLMPNRVTLAHLEKFIARSTCQKMSRLS